MASRVRHIRHQIGGPWPLSTARQQADAIMGWNLTSGSFDSASLASLRRNGSRPTSKIRAAVGAARDLGRASHSGNAGGHRRRDRAFDDLASSLLSCTEGTEVCIVETSSLVDAICSCPSGLHRETGRLRRWPTVCASRHAWVVYWLSPRARPTVQTTMLMPNRISDPGDFRFRADDGSAQGAIVVVGASGTDREVLEEMSQPDRLDLLGAPLGHRQATSTNRLRSRAAAGPCECARGACVPYPVQYFEWTVTASGRSLPPMPKALTCVFVAAPPD